MNPRRKMRPVTIHLPEAWIEAIDQAREKLGIPNRAEFIRFAVRELMMKVMEGEPD